MPDRHRHAAHRYRLQLWLDERRLPLSSSLDVYDERGALVWAHVAACEPFDTPGGALDAHLSALDERLTFPQTLF